MDLIINSMQSNAENEEEDYHTFFLQPSKSPYNITEKVHQANIDLFSNTITMAKTTKVTFKSELTTFEPELTDDDINSIESEVTEIEIAHEDQSPILQYKSGNILNLTMFDITEEKGSEEDAIEEIEQIEDDDEIELIDSNYDTGGEILSNEDVTPLQSSTLKELNNQCVRVTPSGNRKFKKRKKCRHSNSELSPNTVECRHHCIEKLDFDLSMSIKKLEIKEKPAKCPLLKLQQRTCCDENKARNPSNLPCYNGLRSEYGLSSAELEKREKRRELIRLKAQKRQQLVEEYKNRKNQQNEEVFCQWLKDVARRRALQKRKIGDCKNSKQPLSPNVINFPTKANSERTGERAKSANEFVPKNGSKRTKRPSTSPACVFIEVPQKFLERGIRVGDMLVTSSNFVSKKMHILTVSS